MGSDWKPVARGANQGRATARSLLSLRAWLLRLLVFIVFGAACMAIVSVLMGTTPAALLRGEAEPNGTPRHHDPVSVPDLIAGHVGWCAYEWPNGGGACSPVAPPLPTTSVEPTHPICGFWPIRLAGLATHWTQAVTTLPSRSTLGDNDALRSCASSWYAIKGKVLLASILLNAHEPRTVAPPPPRLDALDGQPGVFIVAASEDLVLRRAGKAWLAVQGGSRSEQLRLIRKLRPTGSALKTMRSGGRDG
jgi:hypothetical protein